MEIKLINLQKQAIDAAISENWEEAIELNNQVIELDPENVDPYLANGYASLQIGKFKAAKKYYKKALSIEPLNSIARNNLDKVEILQKKGSNMRSKTVKVTADTFMHIKGLTCDVTLANTGQADILAQLVIGEIVTLVEKKHRMEVRNENGDYVGCLPDDISKRLAFFINSKSSYLTIIKSSTKNSVEIFIRELKKGAKTKNFVSFPENIREDMKLIIKKDTNAHSEPNEDDDDDDDEDEEPIVEDIEEMAKEVAENENMKDLDDIHTSNDLDDEE